MDAALNASLQSFVRKGRGLRGLNDWRTVQLKFASAIFPWLKVLSLRRESEVGDFCC